MSLLPNMSPGDVLPVRRFVATYDDATFTYVAPKGRLFALLLLGAGSPEAPLDPTKALNALGWYFDPVPRKAPE